MNSNEQDLYFHSPDGAISRLYKEAGKIYLAPAGQDRISDPERRITLLDGMVIFSGLNDSPIKFSESFYQIASSLNRINLDIVRMREELFKLEKEGFGTVNGEVVRIMSEDFESAVFKLDIFGIDASENCWSKFLYIVRTFDGHLLILYERKEQKVARNMKTIKLCWLKGIQILFSIVDGILCYYIPRFEIRNISFQPIYLPAFDFTCSTKNRITNMTVIDEHGSVFEVILDGGSLFSPNYYRSFPNRKFKVEGREMIEIYHLNTIDGVRQIGSWQRKQIYLIKGNRLVIHGLIRTGRELAIIETPIWINHFECNDWFCVIFGEGKTFLLTEDLSLVLL